MMDIVIVVICAVVLLVWLYEGEQLDEAFDNFLLVLQTEQAKQAHAPCSEEYNTDLISF